MIQITSLNNPLIKARANLNIAKYRRDENKYLIEGLHLITEAKKTGVLLEVFIQNLDDEIEGVTNYLVTNEIINKLAKTKTPQGLIGVCEMDLKPLASEGNYLILDGLQDPGNVGTLLRSALGFGINNILLTGDAVDIYNDKVLRSAQGAHFHLNIVYYDLALSLQELKTKGYFLYGTDVGKGKKLSDFIPHKPFALILGSEARGISDITKNLVDEMINIEVSPKLESLNVGVAGSIILYHFRTKELS